MLQGPSWRALEGDGAWTRRFHDLSHAGHPVSSMPQQPQPPDKTVGLLKAENYRRRPEGVARSDLA